MSRASNLAGFGSFIGPPDDLNVGIVTAVSYYGDGSNLTGLADTSRITSDSLVVLGVTTTTDLNVTNTTTTNSSVVGSAVTINSTGIDAVGVITATSFSGDGSNLSGVVSGIELEQEGNSVGTSITAINFASGATLTTASGGISTVTIESGGSGEFYTGITSSIVMNPLGYATTMFTFPATAGKQYVINSLNAANVYSGLSTANLIAWVQDSSGNPTYIAYNIPITNGGLVEVLKNPFVAGPSDEIHMWTTNTSYSGIANAVEAYMNYTENDSTEYISVYYQSSSTTTDAVGILTSTTYPSNLQSIRLTNRTDTGDYPVSVSITSGVVTTYLAKDLIIPRYAVVDILDRQKRIEINDVVKVSVAQTSTIDVIIAGKQITS